MSSGTGVQQRSVAKVFVLSLITFGIYFVYTIHKYHTEFDQEPQLDSGMDPMIRTILFLIPFAQFYSMWLFCQDVEELTGESGVKYFVLWFFIIGPYLAMSSLNDYAA